VVFDTIDNDSPDYWDVIGAILSVLGSVIGEIPPENHADIGAKLVEHIPEVMQIAQTVSAMHENDGVVQ
jgi:hypothetical protein